ncbi:hypothetical protein F5148DRAFT_1202311 [Russula earlei]|uniref:Uncharacterized protein n=1 Tax=Russula earlei TaxID=71964 RepID=A0ACC0U8R8_9AGAM|nr:hypothetical protein F5148DRAFT_1202311 [Russula earlei]
MRPTRTVASRVLHPTFITIPLLLLNVLAYPSSPCLCRRHPGRLRRVDAYGAPSRMHRRAQALGLQGPILSIPA